MCPHRYIAISQSTVTVFYFVNFVTSFLTSVLLITFYTLYNSLQAKSSLTISLSSFLLVLTHPKAKAMFLFLPPRNNLLQRNVFLWSLYPNKYNDLRKQSCFIFSHLSADWANSTEIFCCGGWGAGWLKPLKVFLGAEIVWQSVWSIVWVLQ